MNRILSANGFGIGSAATLDGGPTALELYELAASVVPMGAFSCDLASERLTWTDKVFDLFGLSRKHAPERQSIVEIYSEESRDLLERTRRQAIQSCTGFSLDASLIRPDGAKRWIRITAGVRVANGRAETLYGMKQDITQDRARWDDLRAQAECDPLTGVANRAPFQRFLEQTKDEPAFGSIGALILFDLDGFKQVNDWWGHAAGDACLVVFGARLRKAFPGARLVSRIGGDEFAVLLAPGASRFETEAKVRAVVGNLVCPVPWAGDLLPLNVSLGLAFAPVDADLEPQKLFVEADRALYNAKTDVSTTLVCA